MQKLLIWSNITINQQGESAFPLLCSALISEIASYDPPVT